MYYQNKTKLVLPKTNNLQKGNSKVTVIELGFYIIFCCKYLRKKFAFFSHFFVYVCSHSYGLEVVTLIHKSRYQPHFGKVNGSHYSLTDNSVFK